MSAKMADILSRGDELNVQVDEVYNALSIIKGDL